MARLRPAYIRPKPFEQIILSASTPAEVERRQPAGSQYERSELFRFTQAARSQSFQRCDQNLRSQVFGSMLISQMAQSIAEYAEPCGETVRPRPRDWRRSRFAEPTQ